MRYGVLRLGVVLLGLLVAGCASDMAAKSKLTQKLPVGSRVAVLPFENLSGTDNAAEKITDFFQTQLIGTERVEAVEYGRLYDGLRQYRIRSSAHITPEQIDSIAAYANIDFLLAGSVLEFDERDDRFLGVVPTVGFNCRLIDGVTGETIWVASNNGRGDKGEIAFGIGAVRSVDKLAREMVNQTADAVIGLFSER